MTRLHACRVAHIGLMEPRARIYLIALAGRQIVDDRRPDAARFDHSASTVCEPIKPAPPVTRIFASKRPPRDVLNWPAADRVVT